MNKKDIIIYTSIIIGTAAVGFFSYRLLSPRLSSLIKSKYSTVKKNTAPNVTLNPDILFLTPEVKFFNGKISKSIDKWTMAVTQNVSNQYGDREVTYNVKLTPDTIITRLSNQLPYSFANNQETAQVDLDHLDIHLQYNVMVGTNTDLRTFAGDEIEATYLTIVPEVNTLSGQIVETKDSSIIVSDYMLGDTNEKVLSDRRYEFVIKSNTEIASFESSEPVKLSSGDLKVGDNVLIYVDMPLIDIKFDAKIIRKVSEEVAKNPQNPLPPPSTENTPSPTTESEE